MAIEQFGKAFSDHMEDLPEQEERKHLVTYIVAGEEVNFYEPTGGQLMAISILSSQSNNVMEMLRDTIGLLMGLTDEDGQEHIRRALAHRSQPLPPEDLTALVRKVVEHYTARPSEPQPASSSSGLTGGTSSTASSRRVGKTGSSTSPRTASAT